MRPVYEERAAEARETERTLVRGNARLCSSNFGKVCKALWPHKTAEELAFRVGCTVRTAGYEISGERHPSAQSIQTIINEIVPKWK